MKSDVSMLDEPRFNKVAKSGIVRLQLAYTKKNNCKKKCVSQMPFPLRMAGKGERVKILSLSGGKGVCDKLAGLGLHIGEELDIIKNCKDGKLLLGCQNTRFFLGGGMAWKIQVVIVQKQNKEK